MSSSRLMRLSGLAALVGFAVLTVIEIVSVFAFPDTMALSAAAVSNTWFVLHLLLIITMLLGLLGLLGLYARQAEQTGVPGLIGVLMSFFGLALFFAWEWSETFIWPVLAQATPHLVDHPDLNLLMALNASQSIHWLLFGAGLILFGVATLRAGVLPRGAAVLVLVGAVVTLVVNGVGVPVPEASILGFLLGLLSLLVAPGLAWMGYAVWSQPSAAAKPFASMAASGPVLTGH
jgi:hypothetical protein